MGARPRWARVAFTELARSWLESMSVPSRSKMRRFIEEASAQGVGGTGRTQENASPRQPDFTLRRAACSRRAGFLRGRRSPPFYSGVFLSRALRGIPPNL